MRIPSQLVYHCFSLFAHGILQGVSKYAAGMGQRIGYQGGVLEKHEMN